MNSLEFLGKLYSLKVPLIRTNEIAGVLGLSVSSAGKYLERLREQRIVERIESGKWILNASNFDRLQIAEFLTSPLESYISLHTALYHHGMIEQIPAQIYSVTVDRSRVVHTPVGTYSFHHCNPEFFVGYEYIKPFLKLATPEKALVDYFYFSPTKSRQFTRLPELEIPKKFSWKKALKFCDMIPSLRTRSLVASRLNLLSFRSEAERSVR